MEMVLPEWLANAEIRTKPRRSEFSAFVEEQTDLFVESMQDAADNHWHLLQWQMNGADQEEIGAEMKRWWGRQIRRFQRGIQEERRRERETLSKRRLRREIRLRRVAEAGLQSMEIQLDQARDELAGERAYRSFLEEQFLCRECGSRSWD